MTGLHLHKHWQARTQIRCGSKSCLLQQLSMTYARLVWSVLCRLVKVNIRHCLRTLGVSEMYSKSLQSSPFSSLSEAGWIFSTQFSQTTHHSRSYTGANMRAQLSSIKPDTYKTYNNATLPTAFYSEKCSFLIKNVIYVNM